MNPNTKKKKKKKKEGEEEGNVGVDDLRKGFIEGGGREKGRRSPRCPGRETYFAKRREKKKGD